jgi:hypothetical protein
MTSGPRWWGSWPATPGRPATRTTSTCGSSPHGAPPMGCTCSMRSAPTSSATPATWSPQLAFSERALFAQIEWPGSRSVPLRGSPSLSPELDRESGDRTHAKMITSTRQTACLKPGGVIRRR